MLHQQILFSQNGKVFNDLYYFEKVENTRGRNLKICFFPLSIYINFSFHEVRNISPVVLFSQRGTKFDDLYHFQKVKNTS